MDTDFTIKEEKVKNNINNFNKKENNKKEGGCENG